MIKQRQKTKKRGTLQSDNGVQGFARAVRVACRASPAVCLWEAPPRASEGRTEGGVAGATFGAPRARSLWLAFRGPRAEARGSEGCWERGLQAELSA